MLTVKELEELAQKLDDAAFAKQLGPFVLVQRPIPQEDQDRARFVGTGPTVKVNKAKRHKLFEFEDNFVATLPPVEARDAFLIGRAPDCDVVLEDASVSKHHARINWVDGKATVEDLESSNGTLVNGVKLNQVLPLNDLDALDFGDVKVQFLTVHTLRARMGH